MKISYIDADNMGGAIINHGILHQTKRCFPDDCYISRKHPEYSAD